ncbi:hypothetical protein [Dongia mobilis]|jgi:hypothetical protein|uniref:hypothetical protein n=1 Tax=Dongia sp. TaxID=1977262 RepID=UPI0026EBBE20
MNPIRVAALAILAAAALLLVLDVMQNLLSNSWNGMATGYIWSMVWPASLQGVQHAIEGISVTLWQRVLLPILMLPAWVLLFAIGILMLVFGKRGDD